MSYFIHAVLFVRLIIVLEGGGGGGGYEYPDYGVPQAKFIYSSTTVFIRLNQYFTVESYMYKCPVN